MSLILGLTKSELKKRLELGQLDLELLNRQINERSEAVKLEALLESKNFELDLIEEEPISEIKQL